MLHFTRTKTKYKDEDKDKYKDNWHDCHKKPEDRDRPTREHWRTIAPFYKDKDNDKYRQ